MVRYDRDVPWPWGRYKGVPLSCIPLDYLAWFVAKGQDRVWLALIERELLCRKLGAVITHSRTRFDTDELVSQRLLANEQRQKDLRTWSNRDKSKKQSFKTKSQPKSQPKPQPKPHIQFGPVLNFDGTPADLSTPPWL